MKEQRTKQILICLAASLGCFWLGNRVGLLYVSAVGTVTQRLAAAVNLSKIVLHPLQLSSSPIPVGCGVGAILLAGLAYFCIKYSGHRLVPQKEYGSARWGTAADIAPFLHEKASVNIPLTATESLSLAMKMPVTAENNYNRNKNVIVFGPSGSGKSYSVAGPQLLQFNSNYVLSDPKGELLDTYGNVLVSQGYDVVNFAGGLLLLFGAVTLGTNLKDHNGPGISSGAWSIAGGVLIIAVATYFGTLTVS